MRTQLYALFRRYGKEVTLITRSRTVNALTGEVGVTETKWTGTAGHVPYQALGQLPSEVVVADAWFITDQIVTTETEIICGTLAYKVLKVHQFDMYAIVAAKAAGPAAHYAEVRHEFTPTVAVSSSTE
jgi:hypothetical protein